MPTTPPPLYDPDLLTSGKAAHHLGIPHRTLVRWADAGYIKVAAVKPSGHRLFSIKDLDAFLADEKLRVQS